MADVIAMVHERCYCHGTKADVVALLCLFYADVIAMCVCLADVIANIMWKMLNHIMYFNLLQQNCRKNIFFRPEEAHSSEQKLV